MNLSIKMKHFLFLFDWAWSDEFLYVTPHGTDWLREYEYKKKLIIYGSDMVWDWMKWDLTIW